MDPEIPFFDPARIVADLRLDGAEGTLIVRVSAGGDRMMLHVTDAAATAFAKEAARLANGASEPLAG